MMDEYHKLVLRLNGTISTSSGEGRLRASYVEPIYGPEVYSLFQKIKANRQNLR